jgi:hypothetical protein
MHNDSVDFVVKSIQKTPLVNLNGLIYQEYEEFFDDFLMAKITNEYNLSELDYLEDQEHKPRKKISYLSKLSKELHIFFSNKKITTTLEKIYQIKLKFCSADIWNDSTQYFLHPHIDDYRIKLAIQIYLGELPASSTKFFSSNVSQITEHNVWKKEYLTHEVNEIVYKKNKGYSLLNNEYSWHGVQPNPTDNRLSVYVRYK